MKIPNTYQSTSISFCTKLATNVGRWRRLWRYLPSRRKNQFSLLLILIFVASFFEVVSIGLVLPFLGALTSPEYVYYHPYMQEFIQIIENIFAIDIVIDPKKLILPMTITFGCIILIAAGIEAVSEGDFHLQLGQTLVLICIIVLYIKIIQFRIYKKLIV